VLAGLAEEELEQRRNGWATARRQALKRGVHVGPSQAGIASSALRGELSGRRGTKANSDDD
jgi:hypothetical protein